MNLIYAAVQLSTVIIVLNFMLLLLIILANTVIVLLCLVEFQPVKAVAERVPSATSPRWIECLLP